MLCESAVNQQGLSLLIHFLIQTGTDRCRLLRMRMPHTRAVTTASSPTAGHSQMGKVSTLICLPEVVW